MGVASNVSADRRPAQSTLVGRNVRVWFNYDSSRTFHGTLVRDDTEDPGRQIIRLDDGFHVLTTECQWAPEAPPIARSEP